MFSYVIWTIILTLSYMSWIAWIFMPSRTRVDQPLPPSPSGLPIVGSIHSLLGVEFSSYFAELSKTYGPIFSLRLRKEIGIVISSSSIAKEVLQDLVVFGNHYMPDAGREETYGRFGIAWTPYGRPRWRMLRKDMIVVGTDTTSNALEFAMVEVVSKPEVMRRAQQELDKVLGSSSAPILEESHILKLPYLQAIVKKTLRLHSTCVVGGYTIPKDSRILINFWGIHRDPLFY